MNLYMLFYYHLYTVVKETFVTVLRLRSMPAYYFILITLKHMWLVFKL